MKVFSTHLPFEKLLWVKNIRGWGDFILGEPEPSFQWQGLYKSNLCVLGKVIYRTIVLKDDMNNTEVVYIKACFLSKIPYGPGKRNPDSSLFSFPLIFL